MITVISIGNANIPLFFAVFIVFLIISYILIQIREESKENKKQTFNDFQNFIFLWILIWKVTPIFFNLSAFLSSPLPTLLFTPGGTIGIIAGMIGGIGYFILKNLRKRFAVYKIVLIIILIVSVFLSDVIFTHTVTNNSSEDYNFESVELEDLNGNKITITESLKPIVLNFWASWCPPCKAEIPELELFYRKYKETVDFYAVNMISTETSVPDVKSFLTDHEIQLPVVLDKRNSLSGKYQIESLPTTIILIPQKNGSYVSQRYTGPISVSILESMLF